MQTTHATTVPIEVVRDLFSTLSGGNVADFDEGDFAVLPRICQLSTSFGLSRSLDDTDLAIEMAWPHPVGALPLDALVVVRANGLEMVRFRGIQRRLRTRLMTRVQFSSVSARAARYRTGWFPSRRSPLPPRPEHRWTSQ